MNSKLEPFYMQLVKGFFEFLNSNLKKKQFDYFQAVVVMAHNRTHGLVQVRLSLPIR